MGNTVVVLQLVIDVVRLKVLLALVHLHSLLSPLPLLDGVRLVALSLFQWNLHENIIITLYPFFTIYVTYLNSVNWRSMAPGTTLVHQYLLNSFSIRYISLILFLTAV